MKKQLPLKSILLMVLVISACFVGMLYTDSKPYQELARQHVERGENNRRHHP